MRRSDSNAAESHRFCLKCVKYHQTAMLLILLTYFSIAHVHLKLLTCTKMWKMFSTPKIVTKHFVFLFNKKSLIYISAKYLLSNRSSWLLCYLIICQHRSVGSQLQYCSCDKESIKLPNKLYCSSIFALSFVRH